MCPISNYWYLIYIVQKLGILDTFRCGFYTPCIAASIKVYVMHFNFALVCLVIIDLLSKYFANHRHAIFSYSEILGDFLGVELTHNYGITMSMFNVAPCYMIVVLQALFTLPFLYFALTSRDALLKAGAILFSAGGLGNTIDRALNGRVTDLFTSNMSPSFPVFNLADLYILAGAILIIFYISRSYRHTGTVRSTRH